jgi:SAM-dependent methyltransferase/uncharacterized protein YbaR (Trm112 family)
MTASVVESVCCPRCADALDVRSAAIRCPGCGQQYPRLGKIPILLADPQTYVSLCRRQLAVLDAQIARTARAVEAQLNASDVLPLTKARCRAVVSAARGQAADVAAILRPVLGPVSGGDDVGPEEDEEDIPSLLTNIHYLFRDWGWPPESGGENEHALVSAETLLEGQAPGRTLVLGAGACRLAYDLHRLSEAAETVVVDVDPLLLTVAHDVIRGGTISLREGYAEVTELTRIEKRWELTARDGAVSEERFQFLLADGLEPPFATDGFDTVITPWFIDVIPADVRDVISTAHRLLKPAGRWLNVGPLRYTPHVPVSRRFTREELFELADRAGFRIGPWKAESVPSLFSKHTGRGRIEWVMAFAARKLETPHVDNRSGGPPDWLLFRHLPVPTFSGQSFAWSADPLALLVTSLIDGRRTLGELASLVASRTSQARLSRAQLHEAVRQCLAEIHPACRD